MIGFGLPFEVLISGIIIFFGWLVFGAIICGIGLGYWVAKIEEAVWLQSKTDILINESWTILQASKRLVERLELTLEEEFYDDPVLAQTSKLVLERAFLKVHQSETSHRAIISRFEKSPNKYNVRFLRYGLSNAWRDFVHCSKVLCYLQGNAEIIGAFDEEVRLKMTGEILSTI